MKQTIDYSLFEQAFENYNRVDNFGYAGLRVLFEYLESYEADTGEDLELDVIALCCDYSTGEAVDIASEYNIDLDPEESTLDQVEAWLGDRTTVCGTTADGMIVYCSAF